MIQAKALPSCKRAGSVASTYHIHDSHKAPMDMWFCDLGRLSTWGALYSHDESRDEQVSSLKKNLMAIMLQRLLSGISSPSSLLHPIFLSKTATNCCHPGYLRGSRVRPGHGPQPERTRSPASADSALPLVARSVRRRPRAACMHNLGSSAQRLL